MTRPLRIFLAGASGVIGVRLVPLLVAHGHEVAGMTRSPRKADRLRELGAEPVVCDVYDAETLRDAVVRFGAEALMHQLTDLPDDPAVAPEFAVANARIRREGTRNLIDAARAAGASLFAAQSVAWELPGDAGAAVADHERATLDAGGIVLRYGRFYGPGTYYPDEEPPPPRIHVDEAARRTIPALDSVRGVVVIADE